jgi:hypothetical protein
VRDGWAHRRRQRDNGDLTAVASPRPPYGFKTITVGGKRRWVRDDEQRELGAAIVRWREEKRMTFHAIWRHMLEKRIYRLDPKGRAVPWNRIASIYEMYVREKRLQAEERNASSGSSTAKAPT